MGKPEFVYANASPSPPQAKRRVWIQDFPFQSNVIVLNVGVKYLRDDLLGKPEFVYANASPSPPQAKRRVWIQDFPFESNVIVLNVGVKYLRDNLLGKTRVCIRQCFTQPTTSEAKDMDTRFSVLVKSYRPYPSPLHY